MIHTHLTTPSAFTYILWSSLGTLLVIGLITIIFFFVYFRHRARRNLLTDAAPPYNVVYHAPALAYEDEIAYIARTGNVAGSATVTRTPSRTIPFSK